MTMPKKGRRSFMIDDVKYHFFINFESTDRAVIQQADGAGYFIFIFPFSILKPKHIADAIRFAISCGWNSTRDSTDCWLAFEVDDDDKSYFEHIPNDDFRVVTYPTFGSIPKKMDASQFEDTRKWYNRLGPAAHTKKPL